MLKEIKVLLILIFSFALNFLFIYLFKPFTLDLLFSIDSFLYLIYMILLVSISSFLLSILFLTSSLTKKTPYILLFLLLSIISGTVLIYNDLQKSAITSGLLSAIYLFAFFVPSYLKNKYVKVPIFETFAKTQFYAGWFCAFAFGLSFYYYAVLDLNNKNVSALIDGLVQTSTTNVLNLNGQNTLDPNLQKIKEVENQLKTLEGEDKNIYEQNKGLIDGIINSQKNALQKETSAQNPMIAEIAKQVKEQLDHLINTNRASILLFGSVSVVGFVKFMFGVMFYPCFLINFIVYKFLLAFKVLGLKFATREVEILEI